MVDKFISRMRSWSAGESTSGSAAVELALVLPILLALVVGALNYGIMGYQVSGLIGAVRAGGEYAKAVPGDYNLTTDTQAIVTGFMNIMNSTSTPLSNLTTHDSGTDRAGIPYYRDGLFYCRCADGTTAPASCPAPGSGAANPCGAVRPIYSVQVTASQSTPWFSIREFSLSSPLRATTTDRFQ